MEYALLYLNRDFVDTFFEPVVNTLGCGGLGDII